MKSSRAWQLGVRRTALVLAVAMVTVFGLAACDGEEPGSQTERVPRGRPTEQPEAPAETPEPESPTPAPEPATSEAEQPRSGSGAYVWWEGEDFADTNLPDPGQEFPGGITPEEQAKLSGGTWLMTRGPEQEGPYHVRWTVQVPESTTYDFWVRKFWKHGPFRWRFNDEEWHTCGRDIALHDDTFLRLHIGANWVFLGEVDLTEGRHELRIEMLDSGGGGAIDCFVLTEGPFMPRGKLKPGERAGLAEAGFFAWEPEADPLDDECPIDLRHLNEGTAGQNGFVRRAGNGFVRGDGEPIRFWTVQGGSLMSMKPQMMDYWARRLAKYGVNMVRLQMSGLLNQWRGSAPEEFPQRLDSLHRLIAALKREGIYVYLGHLWWHTSTTVSEADGFPGYGDGRQALGLLYVNPEARRMYLDWVDALVNAPNPYTGRPISKDPAVAVVEIQNESSLFFWTFRPNNIVPQTLALMEESFANWAAAKYGSVREALDAWGPDNPPSDASEVSEDRPAENRLGLYPIGPLTVNEWAAGQRNQARASDQLQWMTELQRGFYEDMIRRWREDLGIENLIATSNWKTADPRNLGVLERYLYTAGDVVCRNVYFDVDYDPRPERFYAIDIGDTYADHSALKPPAIPAPFTIAHVDDYPDMYTENNWCRPNRYRVEWPFLVGTYGTMMGMDGWTFFSLDTPQWTSQMNVWEVNCPSVLGQFPAAALIFRKGYVQEAPPAVTENISLQHLYEFGRASLFELGGRDALWDARIGDLEGAADQAAMAVDRRAFFVGRVNRRITDEGYSIDMVDLDNYIDEERSTVRSLTDELLWDYSKGLVTVDTPHVQGACGFLAEAGPIELTDLVIEAENDYGAVLVVSLDGKPIAESDRLLVQSGTQDRPHGFRTEPVDGKQRITSLGGYPMNVRKVRAGVTFKGRTAGKATVLDGNGYPTDRPATADAAGGDLTVTLPEDSLYTLVE